MNPVLNLFKFLLVWIFSYFECIFRLFVAVPKKNVKNQVVLVTGGGRNIGKEIALCFAREGAKVAVCDINFENCKEVCEEIKKCGVEAFPYKCDVTSIESVKKLGQGVRKDLGEVDILVNNAGIMNVKEIMDLTETDIRRTMEINTLAHFWTVQEFLPSMLERDHGHLVTIASMAGKFGNPMLTDYCASKFGAVGMCEALRMELDRKTKNIHISVVCPFFVNTNLISDHGDRISYKLGSMAHLLSAKEVAEYTVNGTLRNVETIFVPKSIGIARFIDTLIPLRAKKLIPEMDPIGFWPGKKDS